MEHHPRRRHGSMPLLRSNMQHRSANPSILLYPSPLLWNITTPIRPSKPISNMTLPRGASSQHTSPLRIRSYSVIASGVQSTFCHLHHWPSGHSMSASCFGRCGVCISGRRSTDPPLAVCTIHADTDVVTVWCCSSLSQVIELPRPDTLRTCGVRRFKEAGPQSIDYPGPVHLFLLWYLSICYYSLGTLWLET